MAGYPTGFADRLNMGYKKKRGIKNASKIGSLDSQKDKLPLVFGRKRFVGKYQELRFGYAKPDVLIRYSHIHVKEKAGIRLRFSGKTLD